MVVCSPTDLQKAVFYKEKFWGNRNVVLETGDRSGLELHCVKVSQIIERKPDPRTELTLVLCGLGMEMCPYSSCRGACMELQASG